MTRDPPPSQEHAPAPTAAGDLPRVIGFWGATGLMAGIMIGSGIFATPPDVARQMGSPWVILLMWVAGGVLSLCGALTYAELATMFPQSGGVYVFLREAYGRCVAFVFGWTYLLITKPVAAAGIAIVFSSQFHELGFMRRYIEWFGTSTGLTWDARATTTVLLTVFTYINVRGVRLGTSVAGVLTVFKALALGAIVAAALVLMKGSLDNLRSVPAPVSPRTGVAIPLWAAIVPVMFSVLWTYDGWSDVGAVAGEVRDPQRTLPRIYLAGTAAVTLLYVAVNAVYMWMIPLDQMRTVDNVAPLAADKLLGPAAATAIAVVVLLSSAGSTHGSVLTGARVSYAQARDGLLFGFLGKVHPVYRTPAVSLWVQLVLSLTALWFLGSFKSLADTFVFTMWIFYAMAGAAIFLFRRRMPDFPRPYRAWGYPAVPILFIGSGVLMTIMSIIQDPGHTLPWIAVLIAGVPVYFLWEKLRSRAASGT